MTCAAAPPSFRLLDHLVGWDEVGVVHLEGLHDGGGLRLAELPGVGGGVLPEAVWPYLPPPWLAWDCATCTWYLATPTPPAQRLLVLGPCDESWRPLPLDPNRRPVRITALAARGPLLAGAERAADQVWVWHRGTLVGTFTVPEPVALAFSGPCELVVATAGGARLLRFDPAGAPRGEHPALLPPPPDDDVVRLAAAADSSLWLVTRRPDGRFVLWRAGCGEEAFTAAGLDELATAFPDSGLTRVAPDGFCLRRNPRDPASKPRCFDRYGRPIAALSPPPAPAPHLETRGQLLTAAIDSGLPRCRWHRVRIDAEVPEGTTLSVAVSSSERPDPPSQGVAEADWPDPPYPPGRPHPSDWWEVTAARDYLIDQPAGRYLFVRLRLTGDGHATPRVRRLRLDFPRATSLDALPAVYREEPRAEEFSERFLALFDAALEDLDRTVERFPALFDARRAPAEALPWLARFLDLTFDPAWDAARRRRILAALPFLYPRRGTPAGLAEAVRLVFDVLPVIEESGFAPPWGAVAAGAGEPSPLDARFGTTRLFGRATARFRVGRSELGRAPIRSYGDPELDPLTLDAHRIRVLVPPAAVPDADARRRLERLVASQKPAHVVAVVETGGGAPTLERALRVGIDTRLVAPEPPVLGTDGGVRLNRNAILRGEREPGLVVGQTTVAAGTC